MQQAIAQYNLYSIYLESLQFGTNNSDNEAITESLYFTEGIDDLTNKAKSVSKKISEAFWKAVELVKKWYSKFTGWVTGIFKKLTHKDKTTVKKEVENIINKLNKSKSDKASNPVDEDHKPANKKDIKATEEKLDDMMKRGEEKAKENAEKKERYSKAGKILYDAHMHANDGLNIKFYGIDHVMLSKPKHAASADALHKLDKEDFDEFASIAEAIYGNQSLSINETIGYNSLIMVLDGVLSVETEMIPKMGDTNIDIITAGNLLNDLYVLLQSYIYSMSGSPSSGTLVGHIAQYYKDFNIARDNKASHMVIGATARYHTIDYKNKLDDVITNKTNKPDNWNTPDVIDKRNEFWNTVKNSKELSEYYPQYIEITSERALLDVINQLTDIVSKLITLVDHYMIYRGKYLNYINEMIIE
jgi:sulfur relay (sulfurtransferase) DsrC/TusE family protein